jgi:hypothetical protein
MRGRTNDIGFANKKNKKPSFDSSNEGFFNAIFSIVKYEVVGRKR